MHSIAELYGAGQESFSEPELDARYSSALSLLAIPGSPQNEVQWQAMAPYIVGQLLQELDQGHQGPLSDRFIGPVDDNPRLLREKRQMVRHLAEGLLSLDTEANSYGNFVPTYLPHLSREKMRAQGPTAPHRALLVGALTPQTVLEFDGLIHQVFPDAHCAIVDPEGILTRQAAAYKGVDFYDTNFFDTLPEGADGFSIVQTNRLLHMLELSENADASTDPETMFFGKAYDVLRPDGALMMVERVMDRDPEAYMRKLQRTAEAAGFEDVTVGLAPKFAQRRFVDKYFWSGGKDSIGANFTTTGEDMQLFARKPAISEGQAGVVAQDPA